MTMKPRDISHSQLWLDDDWAASSLSSLGSRSVDDESDSDSDDEEEELMAAQALEDSLECLNKLSSRRTSTATNNNKQSKSLSPPPRHSLTRSKPSMMSKRHTSVPGMASMRNSTTNTARNSKTSRSANGLVLLQSPMRKFRSNTSDSNLSSSRSCHSQRRRVSQANAKWDATCFQGRNNSKIRRSAPTLHVSLGLCRHKQRQRSQQQQQQSYPEPDSVCSSKETRWSTSTHTRGGNSIVRCPKRQNSQDDLSLGDDCSSCCGSMASESTAGGSPNIKRRGRRPVRKEEGEVVDAAEEQGGDESAVGTAAEGDEDETTADAAAEGNETAPAVAGDSEQQQPPVPLVVKKTKKKKKSKRRSPSPVPPSGPRIRPQMPHRQMSFKRQSAAVSMDNVIQEAMAAAQLCDTTDLSSVRAHSVTLPILARDIDNHSPMSAPPHRRSCSTTSGAQHQQPVQQPNSLVSLMSPFRSLSPPRQRHNLMTNNNNNSSAPLALEKLGMAADATATSKNELATCASMTDLTMKQPRRRGSLLA